MTARFRAISLRATSAEGPVGFDLAFERGLTVLRAPNNSGKSTVLLGLVYALGLEGMFGSSHDVPLAHAMTNRVEIAGHEVPIIQSHVAVELENDRGDTITVQRSVVDPVLDRSLVAVWNGPRLTAAESGPYARSDFFVRRRWAAQNELGFHHFLADFLGLDLPTVAHYDGSESPLYLEALFPLVFVEQKHGWGGVKPKMPTYYGIVDVGRRSAEYVIGLSTLDRARRRAELAEQLAALTSEWTTVLARLAAAAEREQANLGGPPSKPTTWTESIRPQVTFYRDGDTTLLVQEIQRIDADLAIQNEPITRTDASEQEAAELVLRQAELRDVISRSRSIEEQLDLSEREVDVLDRRIAATSEDRQRLKDVRLLRSLGSTLAIDTLASHDCPTCHQHLDGAEIADEQVPLSIDDNVHLLDERLRTLKDMRRASEAAASGLTASLAGTQIQAGELRLRIRALKAALVQPDSMPDVAAIERRLFLERRLQGLQVLETLTAETELHLERLASRADLVRVAIRELSQDMTPDDRRRLNLLQSSFQDQLEAYGFGSLPVEQIKISPESLYPSHEGIDLEFDLSASDGIRTKWAYSVGLLELSVLEQTNHPGFLMLDEPGQQDIERSSKTALMRRLLAASGSRQIIVASSAEEEELQEALGTTAALRVVSGKLLQPLPPR